MSNLKGTGEKEDCEGEYKHRERKKQMFHAECTLFALFHTFRFAFATFSPCGKEVRKDGEL